MHSFLSKVFGRKRDDKDASPPALAPGELLDGKFEAISPNVSPSAANFLELDQKVTNGKDKAREKDSPLPLFKANKSRPSSPEVNTRKLDTLPHLSLNFSDLKAQSTSRELAYFFDPDPDAQVLLTDAVIGQRRLNPMEALVLIRACSQAIVARGLETLGIMHPHWYSASPDIQRRLISQFIHSLDAHSPATAISAVSPSPISNFESELNFTRDPHDVAAVLRWGLRHVQLEGDSFGTDEGWYKAFLDAEATAEYPPKAFSEKLAPKLPPAHLELLTATLEIFSSLAALAEANSTSGSQLSKAFGLWLLTARRVEEKDDWKAFYARWERSGRMLEHLFLSRIRDESTDQRMPIRLLDLVRKYPYTQGLSPPTTDLQLLPRPRFTTTLHDALFVRIEVELASLKRKPMSKVHPVSLLADAFSTKVEEGEYAEVWAKITAASKDGSNPSLLSSLFADETIRFLSLIPDKRKDQEEAKSHMFSLLPSSVSPHKRSFSVTETKKQPAPTTQHTKPATDPTPVTPISPLAIGSDWAQFSTSGFLDVSPQIPPLASTLFDTDIEKTVPPEPAPSLSRSLSRRSSKRAKAPAAPISPTRQSTDASSVTTQVEQEPQAAVRATNLHIVELDEAFIDFWSDALLDPIVGDWPTFIVCKFKSTLVPELTYGPVVDPGQRKKTLKWLVLEQVYTFRPPPLPPVVIPETPVRETARSSSPAQSASGKKRFSFWNSISRTVSSSSDASSKGKKVPKTPNVKVGEMGELIEEEEARPLAKGRQSVEGPRKEKGKTNREESIVKDGVRPKEEVKAKEESISTEAVATVATGAAAAGAAAVMLAVTPSSEPKAPKTDEVEAEKIVEAEGQVEEIKTELVAPEAEVPAEEVTPTPEVPVVEEAQKAPVEEAPATVRGPAVETEAPVEDAKPTSEVVSLVGVEAEKSVEVLKPVSEVAPGEAEVPAIEGVKPAQEAPVEEVAPVSDVPAVVEAPVDVEVPPTSKAPVVATEVVEPAPAPAEEATILEVEAPASIPAQLQEAIESEVAAPKALAEEPFEVPPAVAEEPASVAFEEVSAPVEVEIEAVEPAGALPEKADTTTETPVTVEDPSAIATPVEEEPAPVAVGEAVPPVQEVAQIESEYPRVVDAPVPEDVVDQVEVSPVTVEEGVVVEETALAPIDSTSIPEPKLQEATLADVEVVPVVVEEVGPAPPAVEELAQVEREPQQLLVAEAQTDDIVVPEPFVPGPEVAVTPESEAAVLPAAIEEVQGPVETAVQQVVEAQALMPFEEAGVRGPVETKTDNAVAPGVSVAEPKVEEVVESEVEAAATPVEEIAPTPAVEEEAQAPFEPEAHRIAETLASKDAVEEVEATPVEVEDVVVSAVEEASARIDEASIPEPPVEAAPVIVEEGIPAPPAVGGEEQVPVEPEYQQVAEAPFSEETSVVDAEVETKADTVPEAEVSGPTAETVAEVTLPVVEEAPTAPSAIEQAPVELLQQAVSEKVEEEVSAPVDTQPAPSLEPQVTELESPSEAVAEAVVPVSEDASQTQIGSEVQPILEPVASTPQTTDEAVPVAVEKEVKSILVPAIEEAAPAEPELGATTKSIEAPAAEIVPNATLNSAPLQVEERAASALVVEDTSIVPEVSEQEITTSEAPQEDVTEPAGENIEEDATTPLTVVEEIMPASFETGLQAPVDSEVDAPEATVGLLAEVRNTESKATPAEEPAVPHQDIAETSRLDAPATEVDVRVVEEKVNDTDQPVPAAVIEPEIVSEEVEATPTVETVVETQTIAKEVPAGVEAETTKGGEVSVAQEAEVAVESSQEKDAVFASVVEDAAVALESITEEIVAKAPAEQGAPVPSELEAQMEVEPLSETKPPVDEVATTEAMPEVVEITAIANEGEDMAPAVAANPEKSITAVEAGPTAEDTPPEVTEPTDSLSFQKDEAPMPPEPESLIDGEGPAADKTVAVEPEVHAAEPTPEFAVETATTTVEVMEEPLAASAEVPPASSAEPETEAAEPVASATDVPAEPETVPAPQIAAPSAIEPEASAEDHNKARDEPQVDGAAVSAPAPEDAATTSVRPEPSQADVESVQLEAAALASATETTDQGEDRLVEVETVTAPVGPLKEDCKVVVFEKEVTPTDDASVKEQTTPILEVAEAQSVDAAATVEPDVAASSEPQTIDEFTSVEEPAATVEEPGNVVEESAISAPGTPVEDQVAPVAEAEPTVDEPVVDRSAEEGAVSADPAPTPPVADTAPTTTHDDAAPTLEESETPATPLEKSTPEVHDPPARDEAKEIIEVPATVDGYASGVAEQSIHAVEAPAIKEPIPVVDKQVVAIQEPTTVDGSNAVGVENAPTSEESAQIVKEADSVPGEPVPAPEEPTPAEAAQTVAETTTLDEPASVAVVPEAKVVSKIAEHPVQVAEVPTEEPVIEPPTPAVEETEEAKASIEGPQSVVEDLALTAEESPVVVEEPTPVVNEVSPSVIEEPASAVEEPANVLEGPTQSPEETVSIVEEPASDAVEPAPVARDFPNVVEESLLPAEELGSIVEESRAASEPASILEPEPPVEETGPVAQGTRPAIEEPAQVDDEPESVVEEDAAVAVEATLPVVEERPTTVEEATLATEEHPAPIEVPALVVQDVTSTPEESTPAHEEPAPLAEGLPQPIEEPAPTPDDPGPAVLNSPIAKEPVPTVEEPKPVELVAAAELEESVAAAEEFTPAQEESASVPTTEPLPTTDDLVVPSPEELAVVEEMTTLPLPEPSAKSGAEIAPSNESISVQDQEELPAATPESVILSGSTPGPEVALSASEPAALENVLDEIDSTPGKTRAEIDVLNGNGHHASSEEVKVAIVEDAHAPVATNGHADVEDATTAHDSTIPYTAKDVDMLPVNEVEIVAVPADCEVAAEKD